MGRVGRTAFIGAVLAALLLSGWWVWRQALARWYEGQLPAQIQVDGVAHLSVSHGLTEGCGAVVFTLTDDMVRGLQQQGAATLRGAVHARAHSEPHGAYGPWRETPHRPTDDGLSLADRWLLGLNCADLPADLTEAIQAALLAKGSYYAQTAEGGLILIPARRVAVLSLAG